jgi:Sulfotransferase domain
MAKIVWLASYPKSGNTWLRFLLTGVLTGRVTSSAQVARQVPDIHDGVAAHHLYGKGATIVKTHWKYWPEIPLREDTVGAIYVLRHPIEVLESNLNYAFMRSGNLRNDAGAEEIAAFAHRWVDGYIAHGGYKSFLDFGIGSWEENVRSWLGTKRFPQLVVRYERLRADTADELARICHFLEVERSADQIDHAIAAASRDAMRAIEESEIANRIPGFFFQRRNHAGYEAGHRFVGRSRSGEALFALTDDQRARARARFAPIMAELGYS